MDKQINISALYDDKIIRIYQAYNNRIADEAIENGSFGPSFKRDRMTWLKTSFLWMMYRSGWASKKNQERILAIDIKRDSFDFLVRHAVPSSYDSSRYESVDVWRKQVKESSVRIQWDPERDVFGNPLNHRSIQLGIRGNIINQYVDEWIEKITDITEYVIEVKQLVNDKQDVSELLPNERSYSVNTI